MGYPPVLKHSFHLAPMMGWTNRFQRQFMRLLTKRALLYTEMVTAKAILYGGEKTRHQLLAFDPSESPVVCQLGGAMPEELSRATRLAVAYGYDGINLNAGCPSPKVGAGSFGAALMEDATRSADCLNAMMDQADGRPVTIKHRLGLDGWHDYSRVRDYVGTLLEKTGGQKTGLGEIIIHARLALLHLSPKENREIPPLDYERARQLASDFPHCRFIVNGGIGTLDAACTHLEASSLFKGVMIGRAALKDPYHWSGIDQILDAKAPAAPSRAQVARAMAEVAEHHVKKGERLANVVRPLVALYTGMPGAAAWRRCLGDMNQQSTNPGLVYQALDAQEKISRHFQETTAAL